MDNQSDDWVGQIVNEWTQGKPVTFKAELFTKAIDYTYETKLNRATDGIRYYKVTLNEKVRHLFMPGWFEPMDATIVACAMIKPRDLDLVSTINPMQKETVIENREYQNYYKSFTKKWNHYRYSVNGNKAISYTKGDTFKTETVNVQKKDGSAVATEANGGNIYDETIVDSINIDFNQDFKINGGSINSDRDIHRADPTSRTISYLYNYGRDSTYGYDLRIQGLINFNDAWRNRKLLDDSTTNNFEPDIMWTRIEADPMWTEMEWKGYQNTLNSVHQMIINVNFDNTEAVSVDNKGNPIADENGNPMKAYMYRPFFIFYMGPETNVSDNDTTTFRRESQPVILNLNTDFNGVLYAPNSPVIINGNGYKLTGFVVAKEYLFLKTDEDYLSNGYIAVEDTYGHTLFIKRDADGTDEDKRHVFTAEELNQRAVNKSYSKVTESNGDILFYEENNVSQYLIIDPRYVKKFGRDTVDTSIDATDAEYIAALKAYKGITDDSQLAKVTFPKDLDTFGGYNNTATYTVAKKDLSATKDADHDVEVLVEGESKYIAKKNLPYVRVYTWTDGMDYYPFVSVADLRVKTTASNIYEKTTTTNPRGPHPFGYAGVTLVDNDQNVYKSGNEVADLKQYKIDSGKDTWKVERDTVLPNYKTLYKSGEFVRNDGDNYFMLKSEMDSLSLPVERYHKVTTADGEVLYIEDTSTSEYNTEGATYYMKVTQSGTNKVITTLTPPIIVDNKGDLQTKRLTPSEIFDYDTEAENMALRTQMASDTTSDMGKYWNIYTRAQNEDEQPVDPGQTLGGFYRGLTGVRTKKDYRIPAFERVYLKSVFNLSEDSCYSYFNIDELSRINYLYLNVDELNHLAQKNPSDKWKVDDMFFTTKRASRID